EVDDVVPSTPRTRTRADGLPRAPNAQKRTLLMHKIVTGAIAGAAGVALLLGGAGTFALWNASASTAASSVSSGSLTLSANNDGVWTDVTNGRSATINPASALMVPGNTYQ